MSVAVLATVLSSTVAAAGATADLAVCPLRDAACLTTVLSRDGALAVTGVPGLSAARHAALTALARCVYAEEDGVAGRGGTGRVMLPDRTLRRTFAAETVRGVPSALDAECAELHEAAEPLRALVDQAVRRVLVGLEPLVRVGGPNGPLLPAAGRKGGYASLGEVAQQGTQLEHFHAYSSAGRAAPAEPPAPAVGSGRGGVGGGKEGLAALSAPLPAAAEAAAAVPLHTDAGLLIGMVPPLYVVRDGEGGLTEVPDAEAAGGGLEVQLHDGKRARLPAALAAGSLVIMIGDGWHQWINPGLRFPLRPAPHAMTMPRLMSRLDAEAAATDAATDAAAPRPLRLWYGRMLLPPADALLPPHGFSFESVRA
eukprot:scaffold121710_cov57-Phaeocystis_antarctica.AAC.1